ncbi:MAG: hypothetical protein H6636_08110 [Anaerolineales bacterium]|nr:hypothetical protein [Anaerolineales bacterium]
MLRPMQTQKYSSRFILFLLSALFLAGTGASLATRASAHTRVEADPFTFIVGWQKEPVVVGDRNAVLLQILDGETPLANDVKVDLEGTILYGGRSFLGIPEPAGEDGVFLIDLYPTVRGTYELQLQGTIGENPVAVSVELDEVQPAKVIQFPQEQPDVVQMQSELQQTQAQLKTANLLAIAGLVAGLLGLVVGVFSLLRRTKG